MPPPVSYYPGSMKVRIKGKDGGWVVCRVNNRIYDPYRMETLGTLGGDANHRLAIIKKTDEVIKHEM